MIRTMLGNSLRRIGYKVSMFSERVIPEAPLFTLPTSDSVQYSKAYIPETLPRDGRSIIGTIQIIITPDQIIIYKAWTNAAGLKLISSTVNVIEIADLITVGICETKDGKNYTLTVEYKDGKSGECTLY